MESYCLKEKKFTPSINSEIVQLKNGRKAVRSKCSSCGTTKFRFISNKEISGKEISGKGLDIHKLIGKLPRPKRGFVPPGFKYLGPFNDLEKQLKYDPNTGEILEIYDPPTGKTDAIAMQHDVDYSICKDDKACKHRADRKMVKALDAVPWKERQYSHFLARNLINTKRKLGLGKKKLLKI